MNSRPVNPYAHRADEIGLRHGFPALGAIDDYLTPPNWRLGQDPINEAEAQQLYDRARELAKQHADDFVNLVRNDPNREERLEVFHQRWHAQRKMDESVLLERRKIYIAFLQFKQEQAELANGLRKQHKQEASYQEIFQRPLAGTLRLPLQSSFPAHYGVQQAHRPGYMWDRSDTPSPPLGAYHLHQRLQLKSKLDVPHREPRILTFDRRVALPRLSTTKSLVP